MPGLLVSPGHHQHCYWKSRFKQILAFHEKLFKLHATSWEMIKYANDVLVFKFSMARVKRYLYLSCWINDKIVSSSYLVKIALKMESNKPSWSIKIQAQVELSRSQQWTPSLLQLPDAQSLFATLSQHKCQAGKSQITATYMICHPTYSQYSIATPMQYQSYRSYR